MRSRTTHTHTVPNHVFLTAPRLLHGGRAREYVRLRVHRRRRLRRLRLPWRVQLPGPRREPGAIQTPSRTARKSGHRFHPKLHTERPCVRPLLRQTPYTAISCSWRVLRVRTPSPPSCYTATSCSWRVLGVQPPVLRPAFTREEAPPTAAWTGLRRLILHIPLRQRGSGRGEPSGRATAVRGRQRVVR